MLNFPNYPTAKASLHMYSIDQNFYKHSNRTYTKQPVLITTYICAHVTHIATVAYVKMFQHDTTG